MEKCPSCGEFTLDNAKSGYKHCLNADCGYRVFPDRSVSFIRFDPDKIRRVRKYVNGIEKTEAEFRYPEIRNNTVLKRLPPGYPPFGRKVRLVADLRVNCVRVAQVPEKFVLSDTGVTKLKDNKQITHINPVVPAGTIGVVGDGPFSGTLLDYNFECPVQFINDPRIPKTVGVPWNMLEFAD